VTYFGVVLCVLIRGITYLNGSLTHHLNFSLSNSRMILSQPESRRDNEPKKKTCWKRDLESAS